MTYLDIVEEIKMVIEGRRMTTKKREMGIFLLADKMQNQNRRDAS